MNKITVATINGTLHTVDINDIKLSPADNNKYTRVKYFDVAFREGKNQVVAAKEYDRLDKLIKAIKNSII